LEIDIWAVNPAHPFQLIDEQWLKVIGDHIGNKAVMPNYLAKINQRHQNKQAKTLEITFWADVKTLLEFDPQTITPLASFAECVTFYTSHFYQLDTAIRNLYTAFLNKKELLEPFQDYYKQVTSIFLDKWFQFFDDYQEHQTGILQKLIDENNSKTAVIVGDGVAYEIACQVASKVNRDFKCSQNVLMADIPSETENNMSRIYMANGVTEKVQSNREKYLQQQNPNKPIDFIRLDEVNDDARSAQSLCQRLLQSQQRPRQSESWCKTSRARRLKTAPPSYEVSILQPALAPRFAGCRTVGQQVESQPERRQ
jgi:hypothetical protein